MRTLEAAYFKQDLFIKYLLYGSKSCCRFYPSSTKVSLSLSRSGTNGFLSFWAIQDPKMIPIKPWLTTTSIFKLCSWILLIASSTIARKDSWQVRTFKMNWACLFEQFKLLEVSAIPSFFFTIRSHLYLSTSESIWLDCYLETLSLCYSMCLKRYYSPWFIVSTQIIKWLSLVRNNYIN